MTELYKEKPAELQLEILNRRPGGTVVIHFRQNITEETATNADGEEETYYTADEYSIETGYREGLLEAVEAEKAVWLAAAKQAVTQETNKTLTQRVAELETMTGDLAAAMLG